MSAGRERLHARRLSVADAHNDLLLACMHRHERGIADPFGDDWLPGLRAGRVRVQVLPIFTEEQFIGEGALRRTLEIIALAHDIAFTHRADVALVTSVAELDAALDTGRIALVLAIEGAEPLGSSITMFDTFWRLGIRITSLTWNRRTMFADGIGETDTDGRLSSLGVEAITEMERLGMVVDISHLSSPGVAHLVNVAQRPFMATHSSCRAFCDHPRNLADQQLAAIGAADGWVGINAFSAFIADGRPATVDDFLNHLAHAAEVAGGNRVGLGTDFIVDLVRLVDPILGRNLLVNSDEIVAIEGLARPADLAGLADRIELRFGRELGAGFACDNLVEFLRSALPTT